MTTIRFLAVVLAACCLAAPAAAAPLGTLLDAQPPEPSRLGGLLNPAVDATARQAENETGETLTREDVDLMLRVDVTNAEIGLVGILFGGGKVEADFQLTGRFEFRVLSLERLDAALQEASGAANISARDTTGFNTSRSFITAEEFRALGGGALVSAFREAEESAASSMLQAALPGVTVLTTDFVWRNVAPGAEPRAGRLPSLTEPPLVLDATMTMRFLDRVALADIIRSYTDKDAEDEAEDELKDRIKDNQTVPLLERSAFALVGIDQLITTTLPTGWRLNLTFTVPKGFTIEGASDELVLGGDGRTVTYFDDEGARTLTEVASVVTLSNRFLVVVTLLAATAAGGFVVRALVDVAESRARARALTGEQQGSPTRGP